jgi:hypothetical protein
MNVVSTMFLERVANPVGGVGAPVDVKVPTVKFPQ